MASTWLIAFGVIVAHIVALGICIFAYGRVYARKMVKAKALKKQLVEEFEAKRKALKDEAVEGKVATAPKEKVVSSVPAPAPAPAPTAGAAPSSPTLRQRRARKED